MKQLPTKLTAIAASCALVLMPLPALAVTTTFTADTTTDFPNPGRGWLFQGRGILDVSGFHSDNVIIYNGATCAGLATPCTPAPYSVRLTQAITDLGSGVPNTATLATAIVQARADGVMLALKFTSTGTAAQMVAQANAIGPVLKQYADVLAVVQFGFRCAFGEWATGCTDNNDLADQTTIRNAILAMVPTGVPLEFRTPWKMQQWYGSTPVTEAQFLSGASGIGRIGFNNDCFLTGPGLQDSSTYPGNISSTGFTSTLTTTQQRAYVMAATNYVPFGAETCNNSQGAIGAGGSMRTACSDILAEGAEMHVVHMNRGYAPNFMAAWAAGGCIQQVSRLMGYRFQYDSATYTSPAARGTTVSFYVQMRNVGWARNTDQSRLQVVVKPASGSDINCYSSTQLRELPPQATSSSLVRVNCTIPGGTATGAATVYLKMPSPYATTLQSGLTLAQSTNFTKRPANAVASWDATNFRYAAGSLTIN